VEFDPAPWRAELILRLQENLEEAARVISDQIESSITTPYPPASTPGQSPHLRTGRLWQSWDILVQPEELTAYIGTDVEYAPILENEMNRPFIATGFEAAWPEAMRVLVGG
jgi:hypothetical protein